MRNALIKRMLIFTVIGIVLAGLISEIGFRLQGNTSSREAKTIQLVIPAGTSEKVAGGQSVIPSGQVFVEGDTLVVYNQDSVTQTLGPLVIPPGSTASIRLDQPGKMNYTCSFQPTKLYGMEVQQALTMSMRLEAALLAGIPLGVLTGVYSLVAKPLKPKVPPSQA